MSAPAVMQFEYPNTLAALEQLAADLEAFAAQTGLDPDTRHTFNLCLDELITNIVSYGYDAGVEDRIFLEMRADPGEWVAVLRDKARAFDPLTEAPQPDLDAAIEDRKIGGLGVYFVKTLMTRTSYHREGAENILELAKAR